MEKQPTEKQLFDYDQAVELLQAFHKVSGLGGALFVPSGEDRVRILHALDSCKGRCPRCVSVQDDGTDSWAPACQRVHRTAAHMADRFGGRYFYLCEEDRIFFAVPVVADGGLAAALTVGPVHIFEVEENRVLREGLKKFPVRSPAYVHHLSTLLSACAVSVSDSSQSSLRAIKQANLEQQSKIHRIIEQTKEDRYREYPVKVEEDLMTAVRAGDGAAARARLNDLLGMVMSSHYVGEHYSFLEHAADVVTLCSRAAMRAGVAGDAVLDAARLYRNELARLRTNEQMCNCLQRCVEHMVFLVTRLADADFDDDIYRAIEHIRQHYNWKLTLENVAREVGFSPSYFSKVFKKKMGCNFSAYLNRVRVDASKSGLLATNLAISEIARMSGFDDVSYYTRVFKRLVGVTPGYYRSHRGQVDRGKERSPE